MKIVLSLLLLACFHLVAYVVGIKDTNALPGISAFGSVITLYLGGTRMKSSLKLKPPISTSERSAREKKVFDETDVFENWYASQRKYGHLFDCPNTIMVPENWTGK